MFERFTDREGQGIAAQVLMNLGLTLEQVRGNLLVMLGTERPAIAESRQVAVSEDLPDLAKEVLKHFDCLVEQLQQAKEAEIQSRDWEKAASIRDHQYAVKKLLAEIAPARIA